MTLSLNSYTIFVVTVSRLRICNAAGTWRLRILITPLNINKKMRGITGVIKLWVNHTMVGRVTFFATRATAFWLKSLRTKKNDPNVEKTIREAKKLPSSNQIHTHLYRRNPKPRHKNASFSSLPPFPFTWQMAPIGSNLMVMSFPNREELSFRTVLALPNDSKIGLACWMVGPQKRTYQSRMK